MIRINNLVIFFGLLIFNFTILMPSISSNVIQHDDYNYFNINVHQRFFFIHPQAIFSYYFGRPIHGLYLNLSAVLFPFIGIFGLRIINILLSTFSAFRLQTLIKQFSNDENTGICVSLSYCLLPGIIFCELLLGAAIGFLGFIFALEAGRIFNKFNYSNFLALFLVFLSLCTAQTTSVGFFLYPLIKFFYKIDDKKTYLDFFYRVCCFAAISTLYFLILKFISEPYFLMNYPEAAHVITDNSPYITSISFSPLHLIKKLFLIINMSMTQFLPHFKILSYLFCLTLLISSLIIFFKKNILKTSLFGFLFLIIVTIVFSLPVLLAKNGIVYFRTTHYVCLSFIILFFISHEKSLFLRKINSRVLLILIMFLSSLSLTNSSANFTNSEYLLFKNAYQYNYIYKPNSSLIINDEFYLPITDENLAKLRLKAEN